MAVAVLDANFVITTVNDEYLAQVMSREASVGTSFVDMFIEADRQKVSDALARSAGGGMERVVGVRVLRCGQGPNDVPRSATYNWTLLKHNDGFLGAVAGTSGTSSSEAQQLKRFFNRAPIAMHWLSSNGKVLWANDRELQVLGYSREEYVGADIMDFCPDSKDDVLETLKQLRSSNTVHDVPIRFRTKAGKIKHMLIDASVVYNESDGSFDHTQCFARADIGRTVRKARTRAAATAANKLAERKERFSSMLLHSIRTPLHAMTLILSDPASINVPSLAEQLGQLSGMCESVAQAMKFDDGYFVTPLRTPIILSSLVRECLQVKGMRNEIVIEELGFDESLVVLADAIMIRTVLEELIAYADVRCPAGALIRLFVERAKENTPGGVKQEGEGDLFEFRVVDCGQELDVSQIEHMIQNCWLTDTDEAEQREEYDSAEPSSEEEETARVRRIVSLDEGPTVRLSIAFNLVRCLDSILRVVSDSSTTTFKFTLALQTSTLQDPGTDSEVVPTTSTLPKPKPGFTSKHQPGRGIDDGDCQRVLIVEDNTVCQKMCKRIIMGLGYKADTADNGAIAVEMVTTKDVTLYDMVLMDIRMPVMDGITAALKIREVCPDLPIVAFSAEEGEATQAQALNVMAGFVAKPANPNKMKEIIQHFARRPSCTLGAL